MDHRAVRGKVEAVTAGSKVGKTDRVDMVAKEEVMGSPEGVRVVIDSKASLKGI
jgi:hypothetical protein